LFRPAIRLTRSRPFHARRPIGQIAFLLSAVVATACGEKPMPIWHQETGYRWRDLDVSSVGAPGFTPMKSGRTRITFQNDVSDSTLVGNRVLGQGAGVCLGDVDGDGRPDVFLARTEGSNALYRNRGDWRFDDITASAGVGAPDRFSTGCALADVDGDGDLDLVLLATKGPNAIFLNDGRAHFTEHRDLGLGAAGKGGTTVTMADVDGTGRLALFVANYKPYSILDSIPPQQRTYSRMVRQVGPNRYEVAPEFQREYRLVMRPDMGGLRLSERASTNDFYTNDGHGHFSRVPFVSGNFRDAKGQPLSGDPESFSLDAKFADLNGDGAPDLYVTNDFEDLDELWFNDGHGRFQLADWTRQRQMKP
jgi:hypothetical protein